MDAQAALRALTFNKLHVFLGVPALSEQEEAAGNEDELGEGLCDFSPLLWHLLSEFWFFVFFLRLINLFKAN